MSQRVHGRAIGAATQDPTAGHSTRRARRLAVPAVVAGLSILLAACGGGGSTADDTNTGPTKIRLLTAGNAIAAIDAYVAKSAGIFEKHNLDVEMLPPLSNATQAVMATAGGDAEVALTPSSALFAALAAEREVRGVAIGAAKPTLLVVVNKKTLDAFASQGVTPSSPLVDRVKMLPKISIASTAAGGVVETSVKSLMDDFGVQPAAQQFQAVSDAGAAVAAVLRGSVDAIAYSPPASMTIVKQGDGAVWISGPEDAIPSWDAPYFIHTASKAFADKNTKALEAYRAALTEAGQLIQSNPREAAKAVKEKFYADTEEKLYKASFASASLLFTDGPTAMTETQFQTALKQYNQTAKKPVDVKMGDAFDLG